MNVLFYIHDFVPIFSYFIDFSIVSLPSLVKGRNEIMKLSEAGEWNGKFLGGSTISRPDRGNHDSNEK